MNTEETYNHLTQMFNQLTIKLGNDKIDLLTNEDGEIEVEWGEQRLTAGYYETSEKPAQASVIKFSTPMGQIFVGRSLTEKKYVLVVHDSDGQIVEDVRQKEEIRSSIDTAFSVFLNSTHA